MDKKIKENTIDLYKNKISNKDMVKKILNMAEYTNLGYSFFINPFENKILFKFKNKTFNSNFYIEGLGLKDTSNIPTTKCNPYLIFCAIKLYKLVNNLPNYLENKLPLITVAKNSIVNPELFNDGTYEGYLKLVDDSFLINIFGSFRGYVEGQLFFSNKIFYTSRIAEL
jgi:hypothetical protein